MTDENETTETLADLLARIECKLVSVLVGYYPEHDKPRDKRWPHYEWRVTLERAGERHSFDYTCGVGHVNPMPKGFRATHDKREREKAWEADPRAPRTPNAAAVVSTLVASSSGSDQTFEGWCSDFGYNPDSRKALDTYLASQGEALALRRLFREHWRAVVDAASEH